MADPSYIDADGVLTDGEAWVGIAHASLSLPAATVTWTSTNDGQTGDFSQYKNLFIVGYARSDRGSGSYDLIQIALNNDTTDANYAGNRFSADGSSTGASVNANRGLMHVPSEASDDETFNAFTVDLSDINSGKYKTTLTQNACRHSDTPDAGIVEVWHKTWLSQAAITEIDLTVQYGTNFVAGCVFDLFGVLPRMVA